MTTTPVRHWADRVTDPRLSLSLRVVAYAEAHADQYGHAPLTAGALLRAVDPSGTTAAPSLSRAITVAIRGGWLHEISSARCLVLARGVGVCPCPATHRNENVRGQR